MEQMTLFDSERPYKYIMDTSSIWHRRKNYPPHAQRNIKSLSKHLNINNAESTKTNSAITKGQ